MHTLPFRKLAGGWRRLAVRLGAVAFACCLFQTVALSGAPAAALSYTMTPPEYQFLAVLNADRQANGLPALAANGTLAGIAHTRSQQMLSTGVFSHYDPSGNLYFAQLLNGAGFPYLTAGENLAENNYDLSQSLGVANTGLMNSPTHRANILNSRYNEVGIGISGPGGAGQFYYTEIFAQVP